MNNLYNLVTQQAKKLDSLQKDNFDLNEKVGILDDKINNFKISKGILGGDSQFLSKKK